MFLKYSVRYKSSAYFSELWEKILERERERLRSLALNLFNLRFWCSPWPGLENSASERPRRSLRMPCLSGCRAISLYRRTRRPRVCCNSLRSQGTPGNYPGRRSSCRKSASANRSGWQSCLEPRAWRTERMLCNLRYRYPGGPRIRRSARRIPAEEKLVKITLW